MIKQKKSYCYSKLNGVLRYILVHTATQLFPLYVVNEYPKSGASWIGEMLGEAINVPFPRNCLPLLRSTIMHGHMMHSWNMHNVLIVWRDGRDVLVSQYYHYLFANERGNIRIVEKCRAELGFLDYDDITGNLVPFIEYVFEQKQHPRFSWSDFVKKWAGSDNYVHVHYENMRAHPVEELRRIFVMLTNVALERERAITIVGKYSFKRMSGREAGEEVKHSFMRKGIVGDWKRHFDQESRERYHAYAGNELIRLGYESDDSWV